jgi:hypothetical protein
MVIDWDFILVTCLQFIIFYILIFYCKLLYYQQLLQFEEFEKGKIKNNFIFFLFSFLYTSISLLIVPFFLIISNIFEGNTVNYVITFSIIIIIYCFWKTLIYTFLEDKDFSIINGIVNST